MTKEGLSIYQLAAAQAQQEIDDLLVLAHDHKKRVKLDVARGDELDFKTYILWDEQNPQDSMRWTDQIHKGNHIPETDKQVNAKYVNYAIEKRFLETLEDYEKRSNNLRIKEVVSTLAQDMEQNLPVYLQTAG